MADLQAYVAEQKKGKSSFLGKTSAAASESDSDSAGLLSWMPSSVNISMPSVFGGDANEKQSESTWFSESKKDPMCPALSRTQRLIGFACCICGGIFCFSLASLYVPVLLLKARKFALLYSLGSLFMINSFSFLWGPWNHAKHLMTRERLPFTAAYFGSLFATLYFAMWLRSTLFTSIAAIVQIIALLWYLVSYIPGGQTGLSFISRLFTSAVSRTVSKSMPV